MRFTIVANESFMCFELIFFMLSLEPWENENFIANLRLLPLNGFILDSQIVKQKVLNIVIRQQ